MYTYRALVTAVYDGDTITADIDMGFEVTFKNQKIRLYGINSPEVKGVTRPAGLASRDALRKKILNKQVILHTKKDDKEKFGRYLGIVTLDDENINDWLVKNGYADVYLSEEE